jgi:hypothetical protein
MGTPKDTGSSPTSPRRLARFSRRVWRGYWQVFGLAGMADRKGRCFYWPIFPVSEKTSGIGCSILLTAAGQFRILTGFPFDSPCGETMEKPLYLVLLNSASTFLVDTLLKGKSLTYALRDRLNGTKAKLRTSRVAGNESATMCSLELPRSTGFVYDGRVGYRTYLWIRVPRRIVRRVTRRFRFS